MLLFDESPTYEETDSSPSITYVNPLAWLQDLIALDEKDAKQSGFCALCHLSDEFVHKPIRTHITDVALSAFALNAFEKHGPFTAVLATHLFYKAAVQPFVDKNMYLMIDDNASRVDCPEWTRETIAQHFIDHTPHPEFLFCMYRFIQMKAMLREASLLIPANDTLPVDRRALTNLERILALGKSAYKK